MGDPVSPMVTNNVFTSNARVAYVSFRGAPDFQGNSGSGNIRNTFQVDGVVQANTTFHSLPGLVYYLRGYNALVVASGRTLTVEAGAILKVENSGTTLNNAYIRGTLLAHGTVDSPVYITSYKDDSVGGDSNGDGNATSPTVGGDWAEITVYDGAAILNHTVVRYGFTNLSVENTSSLTLTNSTVSYGATGVFLDGNGQEVSLSINDSVISDNTS